MWIESHQTLRGHPKVKRAARALGIPAAQVIGHLHLLWWWVLDHAFDGDLSAFDAADLADAAEWDGDPDTFVEALTGCGPGDTSGFLDADGGGIRVHDWGVYTAHLRRRREASAIAHHARWHEARGVTEPDCPHCPDAIAVRPHGDGSGDAGDPQCTEPDQTEPDPTNPTDRTDRAADGAAHTGGGEGDEGQDNPAEATAAAIVAAVPDGRIRRQVREVQDEIVNAIGGLPPHRLTPSQIVTAVTERELDSTGHAGRVTLSRIDALARELAPPARAPARRTYRADRKCDGCGGAGMTLDADGAAAPCPVCRPGDTNPADTLATASGRPLPTREAER